MNLVDIINELNFKVLFPVFIGIKFLLETYLKQRNIQSMEKNKDKKKNSKSDLEEKENDSLISKEK